MVQQRAIVDGLYCVAGRDVCFYILLWLHGCRLTNLFSKVLGIPDVVWIVANHGSQDGGQLFGNIECDIIDATLVV